MIRGACILVVGFALGYSKAMSEMPEIQAAVQAVKDEWRKSGTEPEVTYHRPSEGETQQ